MKVKMFFKNIIRKRYIQVNFFLLILYLLGALITFFSPNNWFSVGGIICGFSITALFFYNFYLCLKKVKIIERFFSLPSYEYWGIGILSLIFIIGYFIFICQESFIYYWDFGAYWNSCLSLIDYMDKNAFFAIEYVFFSINFMEYNQIICFIMAFPLKLLGQSYISFYFLTLILFYLPANLIFSLTLKDLFERGEEKENILPVWVIFGSLFLLGIGIRPLLDGYVDSFCFLPLAVLMDITFSRRFLLPKLQDGIIGGIMLLIIILGRRYYLYAMIGYTVAILTISIIYFIKEKINQKINKKEFYNFLKNMLAMAGTCLVVLLTFCIGFTLLSLNGNYSDAYQAYQGADIKGNFYLLLRYFGWIIFSLFLFGVGYSIWKKKYYELSLLIINLLCTCFAFYLVQSMGEQHFYVVLYPISFIAICGVQGIYSICSLSKVKKILRPIGSVILCALLLFNFGSIFFWNQTEVGKSINTASCSPKRRNDIDTLKSLSEELTSLSNENKYIYAIGSGGIFNSDVLTKLYRPQASPIENKLLYPSHVDLRDGFPISFYSADIVVTESPCEYHLGEKFQRVVSVLNNAIIMESPWNDNYEHLNDYNLDQGITVSIWIRVKKPDNEDIEYFSQQFSQWYSNYPDLFENKIRSYKI